MPDRQSYNEKELLEKTAKGDEEAFTQLFNHWYQWLGGFIFRLSGSQVIAEEVVQDVFLKIWINRNALEDVRDLKGYLLVVSRNYAFKVLKKASLTGIQQKQWEDTMLTESRFSDDSESSTPYYSLLDEAVDQLSPRRKEVYLLSRHERLTYEQIAERLGISRESVKTHLQLATTSITSYVRSKLPLLSLLIPAFLKNI